MKIFRLLQTIIFLILTVYFLSAQSSLNATTIGSILGRNHQLTFGYWNDNLIYQDFFKKFLKVGTDDFVTTSFWSQVAYQHEERWLIFDLYYSVLTNKSTNYRFDLITNRISIEKDTRWALFQVGTGLVFRGNFGGETIQNSYHKLFGYHRVSLPYTDQTATGLLFMVKAEPYLIRISHHVLKFTLSNAYRTAAAPSNFRFGLNASHRFDIPNSDIAFCLQERFGYIRYYHQDSLTHYLFDQGIGFGFVLSGIYNNKYGISIWMTENQYGQHNPHYGLLFSYNPRKRSILRISDILVP